MNSVRKIRRGSLLFAMFVSVLLAACSVSFADANPWRQCIEGKSWVQAETSEFVLLSDGYSVDLEVLAEKLAAFAAFFPRSDFNTTDSSLPVVMAVADSQCRHLLEERLESKRGEGLFLVVDPATIRAASQQFFRAYGALCLRHFIPDPPYWMDEGYKALYGHFLASGELARLELPRKDRLELRREMLPGLVELLESGPELRDSLTPRKKRLFPTQALMILHYMHYGDSRSSECYVDAARMLREGSSPKEAFAAAFGEDLKTFDIQFRQYLRKDASLVRLELRRKGPVWLDGQIPSPIAAEQVSVKLALWLSEAGFWRDASRLFAVGLESAPRGDDALVGYAMALEALGDPQADAAWEMAQESEARIPELRLALSDHLTAFSGVPALGGRMPLEDELARGQSLLRPLVDDKAFRAQALLRLGWIAILSSRGGLTRAVEGLLEVWTRSPEESRAGVLLSLLLLQNEYYSQALSMLERMFQDGPGPGADEIRVLYGASEKLNDSTVASRLKALQEAPFRIEPPSLDRVLREELNRAYARTAQSVFRQVFNDALAKVRAGQIEDAKKLLNGLLSDPIDDELASHVQRVLATIAARESEASR